MVHLVGFTVEIYYDKRTYERQNPFISCHIVNLCDACLHFSLRLEFIYSDISYFSLEEQR